MISSKPIKAKFIVHRTSQAAKYLTEKLFVLLFCYEATNSFEKWIFRTWALSSKHGKFPPLKVCSEMTLISDLTKKTSADGKSLAVVGLSVYLKRKDNSE